MKLRFSKAMSRLSKSWDQSQSSRPIPFSLIRYSKFRRPWLVSTTLPKQINLTTKRCRKTWNPWIEKLPISKLWNRMRSQVTIRAKASTCSSLRRLSTSLSRRVMRRLRPSSPCLWSDFLIYRTIINKVVLAETENLSQPMVRPQVPLKMSKPTVKST